MAKRFAFVSFGILCLMLAALVGFHIGSRSAQAQSPERTIVGVTHAGDISRIFVVTSNGDLYAGRDRLETPLNRWGNVWTGQDPVPTESSTGGNIKEKNK